MHTKVVLLFVSISSAAASASTNLQNHASSNSSRRTFPTSHRESSSSGEWIARTLGNLEAGYGLQSDVTFPGHHPEQSKSHSESAMPDTMHLGVSNDRSNTAYTLRDVLSAADLFSQQSQPSYSDLPFSRDHVGVYYDINSSDDYTSKPGFRPQTLSKKSSIRNKLGIGGPWEGHQNVYPIGPWINDGSGGGPHGGGTGGGGGLADVAGLLAAKKTVGAKALFVLMVPLILLAIFGPILASQSMIPWAIGGGTGGLTSISTVASGRKRRSIRDYLHLDYGALDPRQVAELEKRLGVFMAVQEYIAATGNQYAFQDATTSAYLRCQGYLDDDNKCLERLACEYADQSSAMDSMERRVSGLVLQNIMSSSTMPAGIKGRLSKGITFGRRHSGRCASYYCQLVDSEMHKK